MDIAGLEQRVRALEDVEAIKQLKYRYADACDRGYDADALAELFTEDAVWDGGHFGHHHGREAIRRFFQGVSSDITFAVHYMMNPIITVTGDNAVGQWYLFQTCTFAAGNTPVWGSARYEDEYLRVDGAWKFHRVTLISTFWTPFSEGWVNLPILMTD